MGERQVSRNFSQNVAMCVIRVNKALRGNDTKLKELTDLCQMLRGDDFTVNMAEDITDFSQLFQKLLECDIINPGDISFVEELLESVNRVDLRRLFEQARALDGQQTIPTATRNDTQAQPRQNAQPIAPAPRMPPTEEVIGEDLSGCFLVCLEHVGRDWRFLGRQLRLSEFELDEITESHPRNLREQVSSMLTKWKKKNAKNATKAVLVEALRRCKMQLAADLVNSVQVNAR